MQEEEPISQMAANILALSSQIEMLTKTVHDLQRELDARSRRIDDEYIAVIRGMHQELEIHRAGERLHILEPILQQLILMYDDVQSAIDALPESGLMDRIDILAIYVSFAETIEGALSLNDTEKFSIDDAMFHADRQYIVDTVKTPDRTKDKLVVESVRPGFFFKDRRQEGKDKLLRPERVKTYKYADEAPLS